MAARHTGIVGKVEFVEEGNQCRLVPKSSELLISEAFDLFCNQGHEKRYLSQDLAFDRLQFFMELGERYRMGVAELGESPEEHALAYLQRGLLESRFFDIRTAVMEQEEYAPLGEFLHHEDFPSFLEDVRDLVLEYLDGQMASFLVPSRPRKSRIREVDNTQKIAHLVLLGFRAQPNLDIPEYLERFLSESRIFGAWASLKKKEKDRHSKMSNRNRQTRPGASLSRLESWICKYWTDPRLPLCGLVWNDISLAARCSPELKGNFRQDGSEDSNLVTVDAIRKICEKVGVSLFPTPLVRLVDAGPISVGWPSFRFETMH